MLTRRRCCQPHRRPVLCLSPARSPYGRSVALSSWTERTQKSKSPVSTEVRTETIIFGFRMIGLASLSRMSFNGRRQGVDRSATDSILGDYHLIINAERNI